MNGDSQQCARELLETAPLVVRFIRDEVRRRRAAGLTLPQFRTLAFLSRARDSSLSDVAGHLGLSLPAMSRLINGLVAARLVARQPAAANRRQVALNLTSRGRATLETVRGEIRLRLADAVKDLSPAEQKTVHAAMTILHRVFEKRFPPSGALPEAEP